MTAKPGGPKLLVANRGEIAVRLIRAAREMGIPSVAVYSEADSESLHIRMADEAVLIGPPESAKSYLDFKRVLGAAKSTGATLIHPGYGFLAENDAFAAAVNRAGFTWVGPPPKAIKVMGDKMVARTRMLKAGVPVVPGSEGNVETAAEARDIAKSIGYPVMLKAARGGGGKGMRVVHDAKELDAAFDLTRGEAQGAFHPRFGRTPHREGDRHGHATSKCRYWRTITAIRFICASASARPKGAIRSSSRRLHPRPSTTPSGNASARWPSRRPNQSVIKAPGTVEFLLDASGEFYFLEMNTRLQVEHTVTEMVTGIDLAREQIRVALGQPLGYGQDAVQPRGHSLQFRITAEDPYKGFMPATGTVSSLELPGGPGVRTDTALYAGYDIPVHYDSLIAKLCVWAEDRNAALDRAGVALDELVIAGVPTTVPFHRWAVDHHAFRAGDLHTAFVEEHWTPVAADEAKRAAPSVDDPRVRVALGALALDQIRAWSRPPAGESAWRSAGRAARLSS